MDYLPLESSDYNDIPSCTSTYDTQHSYKITSKSMSGLGGVALTRDEDRLTDGQRDTDRRGDSYIPPKFVCGGLIISSSIKGLYKWWKHIPALRNLYQSL